MIAEARAVGQDVQELGQVPDTALYEGGGYFQRPTLVINADPALSVVREEQFGPILPLIPFDDEADAIAMAKDDDFGLASSTWTEDTDRAVAIARKIEAGCSFVNAHGASAQDGNGPLAGSRNQELVATSDMKALHSFRAFIRSREDREAWSDKNAGIPRRKRVENGPRGEDEKPKTTLLGAAIVLAPLAAARGRLIEPVAVGHLSDIDAYP